MQNSVSRGRSVRRLVYGALSGLLVAGVCLSTAGQAVAAPTSSPTPSASSTLITTTGLAPGQIKHVWLIILENKSYDATFTGLNQNDYLWNVLPSQGALLTQYYGTGHYSQDNYITLVSGQATQADVQADCDKVNSPFSDNSHIITDPADPNYGQAMSLAGQAAPDGANGCTYPTQVATLFNQLDAAGVTWKAYMQDLWGAGYSTDPANRVADREDGPCGSAGASTNDPWTNPLTMGAPDPAITTVASYTGAQADDQYVSKHNPTAWFGSLTQSQTNPLTTPVQGGYDCDASHVANLDDPMYGLWKDLQSEATTPAFSWITPDNCSDAHDQVCKGNNMSGAFDAAGNPIYDQGSGYPDPQSTTPTNYTGGLYASDLFLKYYVEMIEQSPAFKDGGLIDITFDEANPPFTYTGNSFNNETNAAEWPVSAASGLKADAAGQNINGHNIADEPTGWNSILGTDAAGNQLYPGPGDNAFIDRPPACVSTSPNVPANCVPGIVLGGSGTTPGVTTHAASGTAGSSVITDPKIVITDQGRIVTDTVDTPNPIPDGSFVGAVSNTGPLMAATPNDPVVSGSFTLVDAAGNPVRLTGAVTSVTLSAEGPVDDIANGITADPLYNATDPTPGGGDTGSVLISPLITPGTVSDTYYNHYSWLRTMEDIFQVSQAVGSAGDVALPAGSVAGGIDGLGHLGFAAQAGLMPFGTDIFNNTGNESTPTHPGGPVVPSGGAVTRPSAGLWAMAVLVMLALMGGAVGLASSRRRSRD